VAFLSWLSARDLREHVVIGQHRTRVLPVCHAVGYE
jgi:hypothetical protein